MDEKLRTSMIDSVNTDEDADSTQSDVLMLDPKYFGPLWKYVEDDNITDVDFNGEDLWITDAQNRRMKIQNHGVTEAFVRAFSQRVANQVSKPFNKMDNLLEAETKTLRISILHESAAVSGRSICIRKSLPTVRMTSKSMVADGYIPQAALNLVVNCILTKMNVVIGGEPAAGKTELAKYLTQFIPMQERVITIEDSPEWHFKEINPGHDCVEMRVNKDFDYAKAIKTCLRQNPKWIMLSEARSVEVKYLIQSWSTGVNGVTTIHTDDIRKIPSRLLNMMANRDDADRLENDIYNFVNVAMLVRKKKMLDGTLKRYVDQMGFLYQDAHRQNKVHMLIKNGELISDELPDDIAFRLEREDVKQPFMNERLTKEIGNHFVYYTLEEQKRMAEEKRKEQERAAAMELERQKQQALQNRTLVQPNAVSRGFGKKRLG